MEFHMKLGLLHSQFGRTILLAAIRPQLPSTFKTKHQTFRMQVHRLRSPRTVQ